LKVMERARSMRIRLTKHALSRMKEYDILESEVLTAITTESLALQSGEEVSYKAPFTSLSIRNEAPRVSHSSDV